MKFLEKPFKHSVEEVFEGFKTSKEGLSSNEVIKRQNYFGKNEIEEEKINYLKIFFRQVANILVYVLLVAGLISLVAGRWVDFFTIIIIILINGFIGFWQEVKAEISIKSLKKLTESKDRVIRDNKTETISSNELVPGDIVLLFEGSIITSDIRLFESSNLMIDESSITGESIPCEKSHDLVISEDALGYDQKNMAFAGTTVVRGIAKGIVTRTGKDTYLNSIAQKAKEPSPESPLTRAIKFFTKYYFFFLITILFVIGIVGYIQGRNLFEIAYILIAELVSAVPEGLPIVVTVVMVVGALALSKRNTLVRHLTAVETLGSATVIASDKTGTITEGLIEVHKVYAIDEKKLRLIAAFCNDSHGGKGDPIDVALSEWAEDLFQERDKFPRIWSHAFDAQKRLMATAHRFNGSSKILIKGAFEELKKLALNTEDMEKLEENLEKMSSEGLRVLAFAQGEFVTKNLDDQKVEIVGLIGFLDPPKKHVEAAVRSALKAGIKVMMITGDYPLTAKAIAKQVDIFRDNDLVLTGVDIEKLSDEKLYEKLLSTTVVARILPEHKARIVEVLQGRGEIVTVTGDGVNDVPALKKADLGIAMGSGTEAAKSVAKMVITDNNLKVIVDAIRTGRVISDNIRKVIYYLLSSSLMALCLISFAIFLSLPLPLTPFQILWINIVTDGVQDKFFPFAKEEGSVMDRFPKKPNKQFFDLLQIWRILFFGLILGVMALEMYKYLLIKYSYEVALTVTFTSFVIVQWINGIQAQKQREPFFKNIKKSFSINPYIFIGIGVGFLLQIFAIYVANEPFKTIPISFKFWIYPLIFSLISFFVIEFRKWIEILFVYLIRKIKKKGP